MRLAEEYDAAQERDEVAKPGNNQHGEVLPTGKDLGISPKDIHEFRAIRDAEHAEPEVIQRTIDRIVERSEEPTRAIPSPESATSGKRGASGRTARNHDSRSRAP